MEKKNNLQIKQAIKKAYLQENDTKVQDKSKVEKEPHLECDEMVDKISKDLMSLKEILKKMKIKKDSAPMKDVQEMYNVISNFKPSNANLKEYVEMNTQEAAYAMVKESKTKKRYYSVD
jgi:hypothetical protein